MASVTSLGMLHRVEGRLLDLLCMGGLILTPASGLISGVVCSTEGKGMYMYVAFLMPNVAFDGGMWKLGC